MTLTFQTLGKKFYQSIWYFLILCVLVLFSLTLFSQVAWTWSPVHPSFHGSPPKNPTTISHVTYHSISFSFWSVTLFDMWQYKLNVPMEGLQGPLSSRSLLRISDISVPIGDRWCRKVFWSKRYGIPECLSAWAWFHVISSLQQNLCLDIKSEARGSLQVCLVQGAVLLSFLSTCMQEAWRNPTTRRHKGN